MKPKMSNPTMKPQPRHTKAKAPLPDAPATRTSRVRKDAQKAPPADLGAVTKVTSRPVSKKGTIEALVRRPQGTAMTDLMAATGWQEHSIRAALTGLRKAGHMIIRDRNDGATRYRIEGVA